MCDIWCLEMPDLEGPSDLLFFYSQEAAVQASKLSYLDFEKDGEARLVSYVYPLTPTHPQAYPTFYIWKVDVEDA